MREKSIFSSSLTSQFIKEHGLDQASYSTGKVCTVRHCRSVHIARLGSLALSLRRFWHTPTQPMVSRPGILD
jgi:hypothetical protein